MARSVKDHVLSDMLNADGGIVSGAVRLLVVALEIGAGWSIGARPATAPGGRGRVQWMLSSYGRPVARQGIRIPHHRCDTARRRVFPCRRMRQPRRVFRHLARQPFGTRRTVRCPSLGHDRVLPVPHDTSRHDLVRRHAGVAPAARRSACIAALLAVGRYAPIRALPPMWYTVPLRCVDRLCCCVAARHWVSTQCCHLTPGSCPGNVACGDK